MVNQGASLPLCVACAPLGWLLVKRLSHAGWLQIASVTIVSWTLVIFVMICHTDEPLWPGNWLRNSGNAPLVQASGASHTNVNLVLRWTRRRPSASVKERH
ncbi:hypothetical protein V8C35DRAFT_311580 [Trichoderma chlorosporum]